MPLSVAEPTWLLALGLPLACAVIWRRRPPPLSRRGARLALALRVTLLSALVLALAGLGIDRSPGARTVVVVADRSASLRAGLEREPAIVDSLRHHLGADDRLAVVSFAGTARVEEPVGHDPAFAGFGTAPNPNHTDIAGALRLAASLMPDDTRHQLVLLSDGRQNRGDAVAQAGALRRQGMRVDVLPMAVGGGPEVRVDSVNAPATLTVGASPQVHVVVDSNVETSAVLHLDLDGVSLVERRLSLGTGETGLDLTLAPLGPGLHRVRATLDPAQDSLPENNSGEALVQVLGPQRVLIIEGHPGAGANLAAALHATSIDSSVVEAAVAPHTAADLAAYQAVALADVPAAALGDDRMTSLAVATRDLGVGLAAFGGPDTFGPGGFEGSPLEAALPIDMRVSSSDSKPPVAVVLVLESVESAQGDAVVRGAASALVEKLTPHDLVGVTDAQSGLAVPLQPVADRHHLEATINSIPSFGDPASYDPYLAAAEDALLAHPEATKHVILLGDGDATATSPELISDMVNHGISVSAVGVDIDSQPSQMAAMRQIAEVGRGRFYQSESPSQVPDILLKESNERLKPWVVEQRFVPVAGSPSGALAGIDPGGLPALDGYVAATPKTAAEVALRGPGRDPILAQWRYGSGRAAAWTSDTEGRWSRDLLASPEAARLLAGVVASTLPLAADPGLSLNTALSGDGAHLTADLLAPPPDASVSAELVAPDGTSSEVALASTRPGRFEADLPVEQVGSYVMRVAVESHGQVVRTAGAGLSVPYSPEFRFLGTDTRLLAEVARAGGGELMSDPGAAARRPLPAVTTRWRLSMFLLALAALLLPLDVAVRRLTFRPGDAVAWRAALRRPPREAPPAASEPALGRLRRRVDQHRAGERERVGNADGREPPGTDGPPDELASRLRERLRRP